MYPPSYFEFFARFVRGGRERRPGRAEKTVVLSPRRPGIPVKAHETLDLLKNGRWDDERGNQHKHGDNDV